MARAPSGEYLEAAAAAADFGREEAEAEDVAADDEDDAEDLW